MRDAEPNRATNEKKKETARFIQRDAMQCEAEVDSLTFQGRTQDFMQDSRDDPRDSISK